jgi:hypothetical protein
MTLGEIYLILQNRFPSLTASRIRNWSLSDPHSPDLGEATCIDLPCDLHDHQCLLAEHVKEASRKLSEMQGKLQQKKQVINEYRLCVRKGEQEIVELNESQLKLNTLRVGQISETTSWIIKLEQETSNQKDHIRILQSEFDSKQWPWYLFSRGSPVMDESIMLGDIDFPRRSGRESKILEMFYQGNDLVTISPATEVEPGLRAAE